MRTFLGGRFRFSRGPTEARKRSRTREPDVWPFEELPNYFPKRLYQRRFPRAAQEPSLPNLKAFQTRVRWAYQSVSLAPAPGEKLGSVSSQKSEASAGLWTIEGLRKHVNMRQWRQGFFLASRVRRYVYTHAHTHRVVNNNNSQHGLVQTHTLISS